MNKDVIYFDAGKPRASTELLYLIAFTINMINNYHRDEFTDEEYESLSHIYTDIAKLYNGRMLK